MIQIRELKKVYTKSNTNVHALDGVNLEINRGDIYGIIGLSGAGKSSLVRCINRIEDPTSGDVTVSGINMMSLNGKALRQARQKIGMIFQNFNLLSSKTVYENIAFPLRLMKLDQVEVDKRVLELLEKVELTDKAGAYPINLSGGQKQRVGIARALANNPEVLLCDEATSALDPKTTKQILELLKRINAEVGVTLVVITHEMDVIKAICNKVAILENGKVIEKGNTIDLFTSKSKDETKHFIGEITVPSGLPHTGKRVQLIFSNGSAKYPVLTTLIRKFQVEVNILSGYIETIQDVPIGKLLVEISAETDTFNQALEYLNANHVITEVVK